MSLLERIYFFHLKIQENSYPNATYLTDEFEISQATAHRDINYLRDRLLAPLAFDQRKNGYFYTDTTFHLPFEESSKVVLFLGILTTIAGETGLAGLPELKQLQEKLTSIAAPGKRELTRFLHCEWVETEPIDETIFTIIINTLLAEKQVFIHYKTTNGDIQKRLVDPLKLVHYQGRWYLYGWCHLREARRLFHLSRVTSASIMKTSIEFSMIENDSSLTGVFGIFKGSPKYEVTIRLKGFAAETVRSQVWHPQQIIRDDQNGILLTLPVADDREIIMKVLQFGSLAEVLAPQSIRKKIAEEINTTIHLYDK